MIGGGNRARYSTVFAFSSVPIAMDSATATFTGTRIKRKGMLLLLPHSYAGEDMFRGRQVNRVSEIAFANCRARARALQDGLIWPSCNAFALRLALDHQTAKLGLRMANGVPQLRLALDHQTAKLAGAVAALHAKLRLALDHQTAKLEWAR